MSEVFMAVNVIEESGYCPAMHGLGLNKKKGPEHAAKVVAPKLCNMDGGHNKFLEQIIVWLSVRAPRYWWQEADTYRMSTKQSESTMHTLIDELLAIDMDDDEKLEKYAEENFEDSVIDLLASICALASFAEKKELVKLKANLPEGFLQTRIWMVSYKTLRNIFQQRKDHRLPHWHRFIEQVMDQVEHPEFLEKILKK